MIRGALTLAFIFAAACFMGAVDRQSAEVTHSTAMEAPRPIFEPAHEARVLSMPCTYIQQKRFEHERVSATNTRCTKADRSDK